MVYIIFTKDFLDRFKFIKGGGKDVKIITKFTKPFINDKWNLKDAIQH